MKRKSLKFVLAGFIFLCLTLILTRVYAHCQIPCGIYDDKARFAMISENAKTIEKSINQIIELSGQKDKDYNQIVRWVQNKEKHADDNSRVITYYFMAQRIKPVDKAQTVEYTDYTKRITLLHRMLISNMKCRQSTELSNVRQLRELLEEFRIAYFGSEG